MAELDPKTKKTDEYDSDLTLYATTGAFLRAARDGPAVAAAYFSSFEHDHPVGSDYIPNFKIGRAAFLAATGHFQDALDLLIPAYEEYKRLETQPSEDIYSVPGSDREYAWILACGYIGTGQESLAQPYLAALDPTGVVPEDPYVDFVKPTSEILMRYYRCTGDRKAFYTYMRSHSPAALDPAWLDFQQAGRYQFTAVRAAPDPSDQEAAEIAHNYRQLPERYTPALHLWQKDNLGSD